MGAMILYDFQNATESLVEMPPILSVLPLMTQLYLLTCLSLSSTY